MFNSAAEMICACALPHKQIINELGWVEHDLNEIYDNTLKVVAMVLENSKIDKSDVIAAAITNQRETAAAHLRIMWLFGNVRAALAYAMK